MDRFRENNADLIAWGLGLIAATLAAILIIFFVIIPYTNIPHPGSQPQQKITLDTPTPTNSRSIPPGSTSVTVPGSKAPSASVRPSNAPAQTGAPAGNDGQPAASSAPSNGNAGGGNGGGSTPRPTAPASRTPIIKIQLPPLPLLPTIRVDLPPILGID